MFIGKLYLHYIIKTTNVWLDIRHHHLLKNRISGFDYYKLNTCIWTDFYIVVYLKYEFRIFRYIYWRKISFFLNCLKIYNIFIVSIVSNFHSSFWLKRMRHIIIYMKKINILKSKLSNLVRFSSFSF